MKGKLSVINKFNVYYRGPAPDFKDVELIYAKNKEEAREFFTEKSPKCVIIKVKKIKEE